MNIMKKLGKMLLKFNAMLYRKGKMGPATRRLKSRALTGQFGGKTTWQARTRSIFPRKKSWVEMHSI